jgi:hypothetical protein
VTGLDWQKDKGFSLSSYGPVKIRTNAYRHVRIWALGDGGDYLSEMAERVLDQGYLLHYSESPTTWGCVRLDSPSDAIAVAEAIQEAWGRGEIVELLVSDE